jgi:hypothetical protein
MVESSDTIVYVDRSYDDDLDGVQPWPRHRRWPPDAPDWSARCEYGNRSEAATFRSVDEAIAWGRNRAHRILVRLGSNGDTYFSAGEIRLTPFTDGHGELFPLWPPPGWPNYEGPDGR